MTEEVGVAAGAVRGQSTSGPKGEDRTIDRTAFSGGAFSGGAGEGEVTHAMYGSHLLTHYRPKLFGGTGGASLYIDESPTTNAIFFIF